MKRNESFSGWPGSGEVRALTETVHRLNREFEGIVHRGVIRTVVRCSRDELDCPSADALPELVERLARERLREHLASV